MFGRLIFYGVKELDTPAVILRVTLVGGEGHYKPNGTANEKVTLF